MVPFEVIDDRSFWKVQHAQWLVEIKIVVAICLKEEDLTFAGSRDKHGLRWGVSYLVHWRVVGLEYEVEIHSGLVNGHYTNDTRIVTDSSDSATIQI